MKTGYVYEILVFLFLMFMMWLPRVIYAGPQANGQASATIMSSSINIEMTALLEFGQVRPKNSTDTTAGWVKVRADLEDTDPDSRTASDDKLLGAVNSDLHHRAVFTLTGLTAGSFTIGLESTQAQIATHDSGTNPPLTIYDLESSSITSGDVTTIYVGGTLQVTPAAKNGKYEGTITITIDSF